MLFSLGSPLANGTHQLFPGTQPQAFQEERSGTLGCLVSWVGVGLQIGGVESSSVPATKENGGAGTNSLRSWLVSSWPFGFCQLDWVPTIS